MGTRGEAAYIAAAEKGEVPLTAAERAELTRLRKLVAEQDKDLAFLGKAAAYFAANHPKRAVRANGGGVRQLGDITHGKTT